MKKASFFQAVLCALSFLTIPKKFSQFSLFVLFLLLVCPGTSPGQIFSYRNCLDFLETPPGSATTLCESNAGFTPDLTLGTDVNSTTFSSQLPLVWNGSFFLVQNMEIHINGRLLVDQSFFFFNCRLRFGPGAEIVTLSNQNLGGFNTQFFACDFMWKGIRVPASSGLLSLWGCQIEDAEFAITLAEGVPLAMGSNRLNRNYVGLTNGDGSSVSPGLVVGYFFGNVFTWDEDLNPPYPGQANHNNISFSGMLLTNTAGSFGFSNTTNTFSDMMYGIVMEESEIAISGFRFEDMVVDDNEGGIGILATRGTLTATGSGAFHANSLAGIEAHGTNLDIKNQRFTGEQPVGIHSVENTFAQDILIEDNHFTLEANDGITRGIFLERSIASGTETHNRILNNVIVINGNRPARGIEVNCINPAIDFLEVRFDSIVVNNTNSSIRGIMLLGNATNNNHILDNRVLFTSPNNGSDRFGIFLSGSNGMGNNVSRNQVYGTLDDTNNNRHQCSIHTTTSPGVFYCNNLVEDSQRGFHFILNNDNSVFAGNTMRASNRGLLIAGGQIGFQDKRANVWSTSLTAFQNFAAQNIANPALSLFNIHSSAQQFFPTNISPAGWFNLDMDDPIGCGGAIVEEDLSGYEQKIADGTIQQTGISAAVIWDAEKWLLTKLVAQPELLEPGSLAAQFFNSKVGTNMEKFVQIENGLQDALLLADSIQADYDSHFTQKKSALEQMVELDSLVQEPQGFSANFDAGFLAAKTAELQNIKSAQDEEAVILNLALQHRAADLGNVSTLNNVIVTNGMHEANRKTMNRILIKIGLGQTLDSTDMAAITNTAHQCVADGGQAVELARMMLPACETEQYHTDEAEEVCERSSEQNYQQPPLPSRAQVYPNPVTNHLHIVFPDKMNGALKLASASGAILRTQPLQDVTSTDFDLSGLPAGIYLLTLPLPDGQTETRKIVVQ